MDLFDPSDPRPVHFVGIGGAGMSALALIARRRGVAVSGCDPDPSGAADVAALGAEVSSAPRSGARRRGTSRGLYRGRSGGPRRNWSGHASWAFRSFRGRRPWPQLVAGGTVVGDRGNARQDHHHRDDHRGAGRRGARADRARGWPGRAVGRQCAARRRRALRRRGRRVRQGLPGAAPRRWRSSTTSKRTTWSATAPSRRSRRRSPPSRAARASASSGWMIPAPPGWRPGLAPAPCGSAPRRTRNSGSRPFGRRRSGPRPRCGSRVGTA